jgi:hypothetical protein
VSLRPSPNRERLRRAVRQLGALLDEMVLVGGQLTELLVTDVAAVRPRPTDDVDVIVQVASRSAYHRLEEQLRTCDFHPDVSPGAPTCRFRSNDLLLDVMPVDPAVLGFGNRWYAHASDTAVPFDLGAGMLIRGASAPTFLAMKWTAYDDRGAPDLLGSHDVEDIIAVVAGRSSIVEETHLATKELRTFLARRTIAFLESPDAEDAIRGALPDAQLLPGLTDNVVGRFRSIGRLG